MRAFIIGFVAFLALLTLGYLLFSGPTITIDKVEYAPLRIWLKTSKVRGLLGLSYYSITREEYLWSFSIDNRPVDQVVYGTLPAGGVQVIPREGRPRPLEVGEKILVQVSYQYDTPMAASGNEKTWTLEIESEKKAKLLGESKAKLPLLTQVEIKEVEFPPLGLSLKNSNVKGLIRANYYSEAKKEYLWSVDIDAIPLDRIAYGIVPPKSKQIIPSEGPPRSLKVGEKVIVEVTFRYEFVSGSGEITSCWAIEIENEKKAKMLGELSIALPPRPRMEKK